MNKSFIQLVGLASVLIASTGCHKATEQHIGADQLQTAKNDPVATNVLSHVTGYVVRTRAARDIVALSLPRMQETLVRRTSPHDADFGPTIHALSGPDSKGRIAYIEDHYFIPDKKDRKHLLKTIRLDGTADTEIFSRPGGAMWATSAAGNGEIGHYLALAPSGGKVAFLSALSSRQMPRALLYEGQMEIWDIENKTKRDVTTKAIDQPMSWFPDGKRLAYVKLVHRDELPKPAIGIKYFGDYFGELWDEVPAVYILDIESGQSSFVHVGWVPVVSLDGKTMLVGGWGIQSEFTWNRFHVESRESRPVKWPGDTGSVMAVPTENIVLYRGLRTAETSAKTKENSDQKPMFIIKAAVIDSDESQTIVPAIGIYDLVSFGRVLKKN